MNCLYLHIPFCLRKCHYCSFTSFVSSPELHSRYVQALKVEVDLINQDHDSPPLSTLFIGGGTPTCLEAEDLLAVIDHCRKTFGFKKDAEISVEANPGTVDEHYFELLLSAGVNRLSIGVQSFNDNELQKIGRLHSRQQAIDAFYAGQKAGFTNISLDLMSGLPGQTPDSWKDSLELAVNLYPQHLSLYQLMVEEGTHLSSLQEGGKLVLPEEEKILEMDALTRTICDQKGYIQYETSNYAQKGYQCRHNINYWENLDYLAAGAAAVSFVGGVREKRVNDPKDYIDKILKGASIIEESEALDDEASFRETVIMGLRMKRGVSIENLVSRFGFTPIEYYASLLGSFIDSGMVEMTPSHVKITEKGWPFSNQIMAELV